MTTLVVILFYIAGAVSAVHAALNTRTAQGAIAWTVSLVAMPFVAVPAYLVFGRNKFDGMAEAFVERQAEIDEVLAGYERNLESLARPEPGSTPSWYRAVSTASGSRLVSG